jgi:hypothetical protein
LRLASSLHHHRNFFSFALQRRKNNPAMATPLLGKRTRSSTDSGMLETSLASTEQCTNSCWQVSAPSSRVKRQARTIIFNDENEDIFALRDTIKEISDGESMDVDGVSQSTIRSIKSNFVGRRGPLSSPDGKGDFNILRENGQ